MNFISSDKAPKAIGPYSQAVVANGFVFTSGQIALTPEGVMLENGDVIEQATQVLNNLKNLLEASGSSLDKVIKCTMFLADMGDFTAANGVYEWFFKEHKPARSTIAVRTLPKNALIEIECVALA